VAFGLLTDPTLRAGLHVFPLSPGYEWPSFFMPSYITPPFLHITGVDSEDRGSIFLRNVRIHLQD
jgi:hypothetical protein